MNAYDPKSLEHMERAAAALGGTELVQAVVQMVYDMGLLDGQIKRLEAESARLKEENKALA